MPELRLKVCFDKKQRSVWAFILYFSVQTTHIAVPRTINVIKCVSFITDTSINKVYMYVELLAIVSK